MRAHCCVRSRTECLCWRRVYGTSCRLRLYRVGEVVRERMAAQVVTIVLPEMVYERIRQGARTTMPTDSRERHATMHEKQWRGLNRST